jgi:hypothetical protein
LNEAKRKAKAIIGDVTRGSDPLGERHKEAIAAENTLRSIADEFLSRDGARLRSHRQTRSTLERLVYPRLGTRQIGDIRRSEIAKLLDKIADDNGPVQADMTLSFLRRVVNWHAGRSDDFRSPIVRGMAKTKPSQRRRQRILNDDELRAVWGAAEAQATPFNCLVHAHGHPPQRSRPHGAQRAYRGGMGYPGATLQERAAIAGTVVGGR